MPSTAQPTNSLINHGLAFLGLLAFIVGFIGARIFTTINPRTWVVIGGIHFHHFWYGLVMVVIAGWLAIISALPTHRRVIALVFGLGGGLIGDETGLLLTFGDYRSLLTYLVVIGFIAVAILCLIFVGYKDRLERDVMALGSGERLVHIGVVIAALSPLAFSENVVLLWPGILAFGAMLIALGTWNHRKLHDQRSSQI